MEFTTVAEAKRLTGLTYIAKCNHTAKHKKAYKYDELVYSLYLAPANMSGYEVCPMRNKHCTSLCLNESGHNKFESEYNYINDSRIKKTKLFFEHREFFMQWMIQEITRYKKKAEQLGYRFSVRLNNTSDISPESFYIKQGSSSKNILELFPDVQFYDYTKVYRRTELKKKYKNYDLTFSYSGTNIDESLNALDNRIRVAVVFKEVPKTFWGKKVVDGDKYDMRYYDPKNVIIGLKYKEVRKKLTKNPFVV
jgi:hypothetical protein